jgi:hypothetical protein
MSGSGSARLIIDLDLAAEPIGGHVTSAAGARPFAGWLDLIAALERARTAGLQANPTGASGQAGPTSDPRNHPAERR